MSIAFGRYSLQTRLAVGGMAEIFLAEAPGVAGFSKKVAIKLILPGLAKDPDFVAMFVNEAKLAAEMTHPNIAQVYELGEVNGRYFIAMEYVSGIDLASLIREMGKSGETASVEVSLRIVLDMLAGLHFAHELKGPDGTPLNIVHRDVSPHNVLVARDGAVKVTDFGIAKGSTSLQRTRSGVLRGKLAYMAPEHALGQALDRRADLFAAGLVLYELVTGKRVYAGEDDLALLHLARKAAIPPLYQLNPAVSVELSEVVLRALAPSPDDRFDTCETFAGALAAVSPTVALAGDVGALVRGFAREEAVSDDRLLSVTFASRRRVGKRRRRMQRAISAVGMVLVALLANWARSHFTWKNSPPPVLPVAIKPLVPPPSHEPPVAPRPPSPPPPPAAPAPEPVQESAGFVNISAQPFAYITIDGKQLPHPTPLKHYALRPGRHQIHLVNPDLNVEKERSVEIRSGKTTNLFQRFQP